METRDLNDIYIALSSAEKKKDKKEKKKKNKHKKNKKKGGHKQKRSWLGDVDKNLNHQYVNILKSVQFYQEELDMADKKALKKARKRARKGLPSNYKRLKLQNRLQLLSELHDGNFFDIIMDTLSQLAPIIVIIARLVASLILAILSLDIVRMYISKETLTMIDIVYRKAMSI